MWNQEIKNIAAQYSTTLQMHGEIIWDNVQQSIFTRTIILRSALHSYGKTGELIDQWDIAKSPRQNARTHYGQSH
jgi:hypothetical protein